MTRSFWGYGLIALTAGLLMAGVSSAQAQTALCPGAVGAQSGIALNNGTCTNGFTGAFSGAALATQALSDLSQSATQETVRNTSSALQTRRQEEQQRCPDGFSRVNGVCTRLPPPAAAAAPVIRQAPPVRPRRVASPVERRRVSRPVAVVEPAPAPPPPLYPVPIYQSRFGAWTQVFGNAEDRSAVGNGNINCCTNVAPPGGIPTPLTITERSSSSTIGFLGGVDYTSRGLARPDDGMIFGVLTGYTSSDFDVKTTATSGIQAQVGNGSGKLHAELSGPTAGIYINYFAGPFSADLTFKADFYDLKERFSDNLAFTINAVQVALPPPAPPGSTGLAVVNTGVNPFTGTATGGLTNLSTFGNASYRLFPFGAVWVEPTVGFQYTDSIYDGHAKSRLGLNQGDFVMVQGGARFGTDTVLANGTLLTTSLTGLAYSDVLVRGGVIGGALFGNDLLAKQDEGAVRGRGILSVNYAMLNGVSLFAQGDVYGGDRLFGGGGKGGIRVQW